MRANIVDIEGGQPDRRHAQPETVARASIESQIGRTLDDLEWVRARPGLLEFARILHDWGQKVDLQVRKVA